MNVNPATLGAGITGISALLLMGYFLFVKQYQYRKLTLVSLILLLIFGMTVLSIALLQK